MADAASTPDNVLLSTQTGSELQIILHPLVLITISDYITRHTLREQKGPLIGALLGLQSGRDVTIEHAFDCDVQIHEEGGYEVNTNHFVPRLEQSEFYERELCRRTRSIREESV